MSQKVIISFSCVALIDAFVLLFGTWSLQSKSKATILQRYMHVLDYTYCEYSCSHGI